MNDNNKNTNPNPASPNPGSTSPSPFGSSKPDSSPSQNKPLFVTEEESTAPPAPVASAPPAFPVPNPALATPSLPSLEPKVEPPKSPTPVLPPIFAGGGGGSSGTLPPVMSVKKKASKAKLIAGLAAVALLVVAIPLAVFVISQNTELREKAADADIGGGGCEADGVVGTTTDGAGCTRNVHSRSDCSTYEGGPYDCPGPQQPVQNPVDAGKQNREDNSDNPDSTGQRCDKDAVIRTTTDSQGCTRNVHTREDCTTYEGGAYNCPATGGGGTSGIGGASGGQSGGSSGQSGACSGIENAGPLVSYPSEGIDLGNQTYANCSVVTDFVGKYGSHAGKAWALERTCKGGVSAACDGQNLITQSADVVQRLLYGYGESACSAWVTEHNTEVKNCQGATQCTGIKIYKYPYNSNNLVSKPYDQKLAPGDPVKLCLVATGPGTPEVNINGSGWRVAQETNSAGERCLQYDIPGDATSMSVEGRL